MPRGAKRQCVGDVHVVDPWPAQVLALGARPSYSCDHSLADQISLKLGEDREHPEQRPAARRRRVDGLVRDDELDAQGPELLASSPHIPQWDPDRQRETEGDPALVSPAVAA